MESKFTACNICQTEEESVSRSTCHNLYKKFNLDDFKIKDQPRFSRPEVSVEGEGYN